MKEMREGIAFVLKRVYEKKRRSNETTLFKINELAKEDNPEIVFKMMEGILDEIIDDKNTKRIALKTEERKVLQLFRDDTNEISPY